jgi:hypothetical protein
MLSKRADRYLNASNDRVMDCTAQPDESGMHDWRLMAQTRT